MGSQYPPGFSHSNIFYSLPAPVPPAHPILSASSCSLCPPHPICQLFQRHQHCIWQTMPIIARELQRGQGGMGPASASSFYPAS